MNNNFLQRINENFRSLKNKFFNDRANIKILSALIVCVFAVILSSIGYSNSISNLQKENYNLTDRYDTLKEDYENSQSMYKTLNLDHKKLNGEYKKLQAELENYKDQQATIDELNTNLTELQEKYTSLETTNKSLQEQLDAKKAAEEAERQRIEQQQAQQQLEQANSSGQVCITPTGECYHRPSCSTLKRSSSLTYMSISQAQASGYRACKVCNP